MREYVWCSTVQMDELLEMTKDNHGLLVDILFGALKLSESAEDEDKAFFDYVQQKIDERRGMNEQKQQPANNHKQE